MSKQFFTIKEINKVLNQLDLKPQASIKDALQQKKRFYSSPCKAKENSQIFIKILLENKEEWRQSLKTEATITKLLSDDCKLKNQLATPRYLKSNFIKNPFWLLREYVPDKSLGKLYTLSKPSEKIQYTQQIIDNITFLQNNSQYLIDKIKSQGIILKKIQLSNYWFRFQKYQKNVAISKLPLNFSKIYKLYQKIKKENKNLFILIHGDFSLANLILVKESKIYIVDWEWVRIDNPAIDIAYIWLLLWRYPEIQKKILKEYLARIQDKKKFLELFRFISLQQTLSEIYGKVVPSQNWQEYLKFIKTNFSQFWKSNYD